MSKQEKQVVFTNEILYERNISDRVWPLFLQAQMEKNIENAIQATKMYFLFTQQWYVNDAKEIGERIRKVQLAPKPRFASEVQYSQMLKQKAWIEIEDIWCEISTKLENYGIFKKNYAKIEATKDDESAL